MAYILLSIICLFTLICVLKGELLLSGFLLFNTYILFQVAFEKLLLFDLYFLTVFIYWLFLARSVSYSKYNIILGFICLVVILLPSFVFFNFEVFLFLFRKIQLILLTIIFWNVTKFSQNWLNKFLRLSFIVFALNTLVLIFQKVGIEYFTAIKLVSNTSEAGLYNDSTEMGPIYLLYFTFIIILLKNKTLLPSFKIYIFIFLLFTTILLNNSRTSVIILPVPLIYFLSTIKRRYMVIFLPIFLILLINLELILNFSPKNARFFSDLLENGFESIINADTFSLRLYNWNSLLDYWRGNCNLFFGCGYTVEKDLGRILISEFGVFSIDNAFVRVLFASGYIGIVGYLILLFLFVKRSGLILLSPVILLLAITQEVVQSLPIITNLILIFVASAKLRKSVN